MDRILFWLACASALLLMLAVGVAWWEHRRHMARVAQQRAIAKDSRLAHEDQGSLRDPDRLLAQTSTPALPQTEGVSTKRSDGAPVSAPGCGALAQDPQPVATNKASFNDTALRPSLLESAMARSAVAALAPVLASRAELAAMEQGPTWEDTQPMVLETTPLEFAPTQMEPHAFEFEPTRPVDLSPH